MPPDNHCRILRIALIFFVIVLFGVILLIPSPWLEAHKIFLWVFLIINFLFLWAASNNFANAFSFKEWPFWLFLVSISGGIINATHKNVFWQAYIYILILFFILFYIGKWLSFLRENMKMIAVIFCGYALLVTAIAFLELFFHRNILYEKFLHNYFYARYISGNARPMSTLANPAVLGSTLLGILPFSFLLFKNTGLVSKIAGWLSFSLGLIIILLTASRGVFIGAVAALAFYLWQSKQKWLVLALFGAVCMFMIIGSSAHNQNFNRFGFKRLVYGSGDSVFSEYRLNRITMSFKMLQDHPVFGVGLNHFRERFNEYCPPDEARTIYEFKIPDNMYLTLFAEAGIFGGVSFFVFLVWLLRKGFQKLRGPSKGVGYNFLLVSITALIGLLVNMAAYELFYWYNPFMLFCLLCGFIYGTLEEKEADKA